MDAVEVDVVEEDLPVVEVVEASEELHERALAGTGGPDDGELLPGRDGQRDILQHGDVGVVAEVEVSEPDFPAQSRRQRHGCSRLVDLLVPVERLEDPLAAGHGPEEHVELLSEHDDRVEQHGDELGKEHDPAEGHLFLDDVTAAEPQHRPDGDRRHAVREGPIRRLEPHGLRLGGEVALVDVRIACVVVVLAARQLHDLEAGQVLLQVLVQGGHGQAHHPEEQARRAAEVEGHHGDDRQREQQNARQFDAHREHDDQRHEEGRELADQRAETPEQFVQRLDVVRDPGHDAADRHAVVERRGPRFEVAEEVEPEVPQALDDGGDEGHAVGVHGHGPGELQGDVEAAGGEQRGEAESFGDGDREVDHAHVRRPAVGPAADDVVDPDQGDHDGQQDLQGGGDDHE